MEQLLVDRDIRNTVFQSLRIAVETSGYKEVFEVLPHDDDWKRYCRVFTIGEYDCNACSYRWRSSRTLLVFDMFSLCLNRVWRQKCRFCGAPCSPYLSDEGWSEVCHRAVEWHITRMLNPFAPEPAPPSTGRPSGVPHNAELCEACQFGNYPNCWKGDEKCVVP